MSACPGTPQLGTRRQRSVDWSCRGCCLPLPSSPDSQPSLAPRAGAVGTTRTPSVIGPHPLRGAAQNGEGGIRTLDGGVHPHNALAGRRLQPLGHFSVVPDGIARPDRQITHRRHGSARAEREDGGAGPSPSSPRHLRRPSSAATEGGRFSLREHDGGRDRHATGYPWPRPERCPSGRRSATGNRVSVERRFAGSNPALSAGRADGGSAGADPPSRKEVQDP